MNESKSNTCKYPKCKKEIPNKFSCAVINFSGGEANPILYGNSEGYNDQSEVFQQVITQLSETKTMNEVENVLDDYGIDYDDEEKENIESVITKNMDFEENNICNENCNSCENCKYKKYYFSKISSEDNIEDETNNKLDKNSHLKFYQEMKDQISKLFEGNPSEEYLQELVPNSKWVKVSLGEEKEYYVLGLMYDNDEIKYICYGVPGFYQKNPPRELSGYPIWFPLEQDKPEGFGYWLSYQDANSGESVKAIIV